MRELHSGINPDDLLITSRRLISGWFLLPAFLENFYHKGTKKGLAVNCKPFLEWSGREDLNLRPPAPKAGHIELS